MARTSILEAMMKLALHLTPGGVQPARSANSLGCHMILISFGGSQLFLGVDQDLGPHTGGAGLFAALLSQNRGQLARESPHGKERRRPGRPSLRDFRAAGVRALPLMHSF